MIPDANDRRPVLQPPQFGLGGLLAVVSLFGLVFALGHYTGLYGAAIAVLVILCLAAHVAGNAVGTRLRDGRTAVDGGSASGQDAARVRKDRSVAPSEFAPSTRLRRRYSLGRPIYIITGVGTLLCGVAGVYLLIWLTGQRAPWLVIGLGATACAVLGGIWTFIAGSFIQVSAGAWFHATHEPHQHDVRR